MVMQVVLATMLSAIPLPCSSSMDSSDVAVSRRAANHEREVHQVIPANNAHQFLLVIAVTHSAEMLRASSGFILQAPPASTAAHRASFSQPLSLSSLYSLTASEIAIIAVVRPVIVIINVLPH